MNAAAPGSGHEDHQTTPSPADDRLPPPTVDDVLAGHSDPGGDPASGSLVGVSFDRPVRAQEFLLAMKRLRDDGAFDLEDAVVVVKDQKGRVKVTETIDPTPGRAAFSGAAWTGLLGLLLGGPVGWIAGIGVGAGAGAVAARFIDLGIPDDWVDWFKEAVQPSTATVVVLLSHLDLSALAQEADRFAGAELLHTTLPPDAYAQLVQAFAGRPPR